MQEEALDMFLVAKQLEACSDKTIRYFFVHNKSRKYREKKLVDKKKKIQKRR